jgi:regulatory protein
MRSADGERIAPVTYLFGAHPDAEREDEAAAGNASPPSAPARPVSVRPVSAGPVEPALAAPAQLHRAQLDRAEPDLAQLDRAEPDRAELEREARRHIERDSAEAASPKGKRSFDRINNVSMYALARKGMSSREMHDYLLGRDFGRAEVDDEVERLESVALLDDVALGETLVRTLRDRKGLGRSGITAELRRRKLDQTAIEIALDGQDDDELERATEVAHKRASQLRSYDAETAKRRLGAFLMRKGYSGSVVSTAVQRALAPSGPVFR